jgi:N-acetylneuraminic acid mutarotase
MKTIVNSILLIVFLHVSLFSQTWIQKTSMYDYGRRSTFGCAVNGKGYTGLGMIYNNTVVNDFWEYDTLTNLWTRKTDYPGEGQYENTCFVINGKIYVCLGANSDLVCQNDLWEYDPVLDSWHRKAYFPGTPRYGSRAFVIGDSAYIIGGSYGDGENYLADMYMYSPSNNMWVRKTDFAGGPRANGTAFTLNDFGYYGTGISSSIVPQRDFWKYDPFSNEWSSIADFPGAPRNAPVNFLLNNKALVGFGNNPDTHEYYKDFGIYDPIYNTWYQFTTPSDVIERAGGIGFSIGNTAYIGLGINEYGVLTDFWSFIPNFTKLTYSNNIISETQVIFNPTSRTIEVSNIQTSKGYISIYNINGFKVLYKEISDRKTLLNLGGLSSGIYIFKLINDTSIITRKFIVN